MEKIQNFLAGAINVTLGFVEALLGLRLILKLFAANPSAGFVQFIYETSQPVLEPFVNIFASPVIEGRAVLEVSTLFAMLIYAVIAMLLLALISWLTSIGGDSGTTTKKTTTRK